MTGNFFQHKTFAHQQYVGELLCGRSWFQRKKKSRRKMHLVRLQWCVRGFRCTKSSNGDGIRPWRDSREHRATIWWVRCFSARSQESFDASIAAPKKKEQHKWILIFGAGRDKTQSKNTTKVLLCHLEITLPNPAHPRYSGGHRVHPARFSARCVLFGARSYSFRPMHQTAVASRRPLVFGFDQEIWYFQKQAWNSDRICQWVRKHGTQPRVACSCL